MTLHQKVLRTISSCVTRKQLDNAWTYMWLAFKSDRMSSAQMHNSLSFYYNKRFGRPL